MNKQEVEKNNQKIELHNKFSFTKKLMPKYKKVVPLSHAIIYLIVSAMFLAIPTFIRKDTTGGIFNWTPAQLEEMRIKREIEKYENKRKSDEMSKIIEEEKKKINP